MSVCTRLQVYAVAFTVCSVVGCVRLCVCVCGLSTLFQSTIQPATPMMIRFPDDETTRPIVATSRSHLSGHASEHILRQSRPLPVLGVLPAEAAAGVPPSISAALDSFKIRVFSPSMERTSAFGATLLARYKDALFDASISSDVASFFDRKRKSPRLKSTFFES